jgi:hypothetical protein
MLLYDEAASSSRFSSRECPILVLQCAPVCSVEIDDGIYVMSGNVTLHNRVICTKQDLDSAVLASVCPCSPPISSRTSDSGVGAFALLPLPKGPARRHFAADSSAGKNSRAPDTIDASHCQFSGRSVTSLFRSTLNPQLTSSEECWKG